MKRSLALALLVACGQAAPGVAADAPDPGAGFPDRWPEIVHPGERVVFVPTAIDDSVWVLRGDGGEAVRVPVGRDPVIADGPQSVVVDESRELVYVLLGTPGSLAGTHAHGDGTRPGWVRKLAMRDLRPLGEVRVDPSPGDLALSPDGATLLVTQYNVSVFSAKGEGDARRSSVSVVATDRMSLVLPEEPRKLLVCAAPRGIAVSADGARAFVACSGEDALAIVDLVRTDQPVVRVPLGAEPAAPGVPALQPFTVSLRADGSEAVLAATAAHSVHLVDLVHRRAAAALTVSGYPRDAIWLGARVLVATQAPDAVLLLDRATGSVLAARSVVDDGCVSPGALLATPSGVLVSCEIGRALLLDAVTLKPMRAMTVGAAAGRPATGARR